MRKTSSPIRSLLGLALAGLASVPATRAQTITFEHTDGTVTGITISGPLVFTATTDYNYSAFELHFLDLFPTSTPYSNAVFDPTDVSLNVDGASYDAATFELTTVFYNLGGSAENYDSKGWLGLSTAPSITSGDNISLEGQGLVTGSRAESLFAPPPGTYTAYLASALDGTLLTEGLTITIATQAAGQSPIPEPSTYAAIAGLCVLGAVLYERSRKRH